MPPCGPVALLRNDLGFVRDSVGAERAPAASEGHAGEPRRPSCSPARIGDEHVVLKMLACLRTARIRLLTVVTELGLHESRLGGVGPIRAQPSSTTPSGACVRSCPRLLPLAGAEPSSRRPAGPSRTSACALRRGSPPLGMAARTPRPAGSALPRAVGDPRASAWHGRAPQEECADPATGRMRGRAPPARRVHSPLTPPPNPPPVPPVTSPPRPAGPWQRWARGAAEGFQAPAARAGRGGSRVERQSLSSVLESKPQFARFLLPCSTAISEALNGFHH